jgi:uncharacterized protein
MSMASDAGTATNTQVAESNARVLAETELFVRRELKANDASHDFAHIDRVRRTALSLARTEGLGPQQLFEVEAVALLHDIDDWKYSGDEERGSMRAMLHLRALGLDEAPCERIGWAIKRVSFHDEIGRDDEERRAMESHPAWRVLCCVQDADRLDAVGAVGIARTFSYGGRKGRPFYELNKGPTSAQEGEGIMNERLSKSDYMGKGGTGVTVDHFYEKLLLLRAMMKTPAGRKVADGRHAFMVQFLEQFCAECKGTR